MATRVVKHEVDLATLIETEIFTLAHPLYNLGINDIVASLEQLNMDYTGEELISALNKLLHENKIKFDLGNWAELMNNAKEKSPRVSLYFRRVATGN